MMINTKTTLYVTFATVIYTLVVILAVAFHYNNFEAPLYFHICREILFITPVIYLFIILRHFHEKRLIIFTFAFFIIFDILLALISVLNTPFMSQPMVAGYISLFLLVLLILLMIFFLALRNDFLKSAYFLFALSYFAFILLNILGTVFLVMGYKIALHIGFLSALLIPLSLFYSLSRISKYNAQQDNLNQSIREFGKSNSIDYGDY